MFFVFVFISLALRIGGFTARPAESREPGRQNAAAPAQSLSATVHNIFHYLECGTVCPGENFD